MPVSREEYQKLVNREMRRYGRGQGTGGETARDKAVRAANVAAGYGNSTALKYPVKAGGGGRTLKRDGDGDGKTEEGGSSGGGGKGPGGGKKAAPAVATVQSDPGGGPGRLSDENAGTGSGPMVNSPPGRLSPENAGTDKKQYKDWPARDVFLLTGSPFAPVPSRMPGPQVPMAVELPDAGGARPGRPGALPASQYGPQVEPQGRPPGGGQPVVLQLPGRPDDFDQGTEGLPWSRLPDRFIDSSQVGPGSVGGPGEPRAGYAPRAQVSPQETLQAIPGLQSPTIDPRNFAQGSGISGLLEALKGGAVDMGRRFAPWLQDKMF